MKCYSLIALLLAFSDLLYAQPTDSALTKSEFRVAYAKLMGKFKTLEKTNAQLLFFNAAQKDKMDKMNAELLASKSNIQRMADSLHITITNSAQAKAQTEGQIKQIDHIIENRTIFWILGIALVVLLTATIYFIMRQKLSSNTRELESQMLKTYSSIQNEALKLDSKLVEILQAQLAILKAEESSKLGNDHKLPLKVGEEIHRMKKRIANMPEDVKGLKALLNSIERLEEEFNDHGYEIEELIGKKYVDGMKVEARFVDNPAIRPGEEIITDVLRPQIMYKGTVIQIAKVEVGKSY